MYYCFFSIFRELILEQSCIANPRHRVNSDGWNYLDTSTNKITITGKDLWLYSNKKQLYSLFERPKNLNEDLLEKVYFAQKYYSKKYKNFYIKNIGKSEIAYIAWRNKIKTKYPDVIN